MFEQKIDAVVHVRRIIHILWTRFRVDVRLHFDELAFRFVAAANILVGKNVARFFDWALDSMVQTNVAGPATRDRPRATGYCFFFFLPNWFNRELMVS